MSKLNDLSLFFPPASTFCSYLMDDRSILHLLLGINESVPPFLLNRGVAFVEWGGIYIHRKFANRVMQSLTDLSTCLLGRDGVIVFDRVWVSQSTWKQRVGLDASVLQSIHVLCATGWAVFARYLSFLIMCLKNDKLLCECFTVQVRSLRLILTFIVNV